MYKLGLFLVAPFAVIELLIYRRFDLLFLSGLFFGLYLQADWSAYRILKLGSTKPKRPEPEPESIELSVHRLGETKTRGSDYRPPASARTQEKPPAAPTPNFSGPAHEVLGIDDHAHTRTIVNAFRFWIKQFHPDRAVGIPVEVANDRVQRLTQAKEILLERRKARRAA